MATQTSTASSRTQDPLLRMSSITKTFPGVTALDRADLVIQPGEVHGLVGENGAGKSTIIKVLAGVYPRDGGQVAIAGTELDDLTPQAIHDVGVRFIHQELHLVPHFTVAESVFLGHELRGPLGLRRRQMRTRAEEFLRGRLGAAIDVDTLVRDLSPAERKLVQVARALIDGAARLVVFDEPTAPLAATEVDKVFAAIAALRRDGIAVLYVSHYLGEITAICDRVTVFRDGCDVGVVEDVTHTSDRELIRMMIGRDLGQLFPERGSSVRADEPVLQVEALGDGERFADVSFSVNRGEIVGLSGLLGSGREQIVDVLLGLRARREGTIRLAGVAERIGSPADALDHGMVLVPRDRREEGLVLDMNVADNINMATLERSASFGLLRPKQARSLAMQLVTRMDVRPARPDATTRLLSGGNQQKVVLGRWLAADADVYVLDEPTVGVDVGAKAEIYRLLAELAGAGAGLLVSSNDPVELLGICDRVVVLLRGQVVADVMSTQITLDGLVALTTGSSTDGEAEPAPRGTSDAPDDGLRPGEEGPS
jgi:ribose transport system ATP-binding protein